MSKSGKARKHEDKMKRRRAEKAAKRAKYAALAGTSSKTKRIIQRSKSTVAGIYKHAHVMANCGNPGCRKCGGGKWVYSSNR
jgi:hypothetical protein